MKLSIFERACAGLASLFLLTAAFSLASLVSGCYSNTGSSTAVGDITALPEISDAADNVNVKVYYSMTGARVWTAKDSLVKITYANEYTNSYCGVIETRGRQNLGVEIEPLADGATDAQAEGSAAPSAQAADAEGSAAPAPSGASTTPQP